MATNPIMSAWLSEYHKMANAAQGQMAAEISRQQKATMSEWQKQWTEMSMAIWCPWLHQDTKK